MASFFCCSVDNPLLLGQLILATVATHAALNSVAALGPCRSGSTDAFVVVVVVTFFEVLQEYHVTTNRQLATNQKNLLNIEDR